MNFRTKNFAMSVLMAVFALCSTGFSAAAQGSLPGGPDFQLRQTIAGEVASNATLKAFYAGRDFRPLWVGSDVAQRLRTWAFLETLMHADDHGLPSVRYDVTTLREQFLSVKNAKDLGRIDANLSKAFLTYARDVQSGVLKPSSVDGDIFRAAPRRDPLVTIEAFEQSNAAGFLKLLPPQSDEYARLMAEKLTLEMALEAGGWGPSVPAVKFEFGQAGGAVIALRDRLIALGYLSRTASARYDDALRSAVSRFQADHGLLEDGIAGPATLGELNTNPAERLKQIVVAMERERWTNLPRESRYVWVNIPDFTAQVIDDGQVTFETRTVVGQNQSTHRTPEFSDMMEFMVVNPTWNVPRSITTREYLPKLQKNPNAAGQLTLIDRNGNAVDRSTVNFAAYTKANFPFRLKEPPSQGNALGRVKFMFPNSHNIYLHDTPSKSLFSREQRAYSHGCVRLGDPFDFAYTLLARQTDAPESYFQARLASGRENVVRLDHPVPVYIVYRSAFTRAKGPVQYRRDVYGRDGRIFDALLSAGVSLRRAEG